MIQHAIYQPLCFHFGLIMLANDAIAPIRRPTRSQKAPASASKCFKSFTSQKGGMTMLSKNFHTLFWGKCHHFLFSAPEVLWMLWGAKWAASPGFLEAGRSCWFKLKWKMSFLSWFLRPSHEALEPATGKTPHQSVFDALCFSGVRMPNGLCLLNRGVRNTAAGKPPNSRHSDLPMQVSRMIFLLVGCFICFLESQWYLCMEDLEDFTQFELLKASDLRGVACRPRPRLWLRALFFAIDAFLWTCSLVWWISFWQNGCVETGTPNGSMNRVTEPFYALRQFNFDSAWAANNGTESLKESGNQEGKSTGPTILLVKLWSHLRSSLKDSQLVVVNKYLIISL